MFTKAFAKETTAIALVVTRIHTTVTQIWFHHFCDEDSYITALSDVSDLPNALHSITDRWSAL